MPDWGFFPAELRLSILECLLHDGCRVAPFARVSREWQAVIERHIFSRIRLTPARLKNLDAMSRRNRGLVRYIYFYMEVDNYDCADSSDPVDGDRGGCEPKDMDFRTMSKAEDTLIATGIEQLFSSLSDWKPNGSLELDISIYSPDDAKHWFKYLTFEPDVPDSSWLRPWDRHQPAEIPADDPPHNWVDGKQHSRPPGEAVHRLFDPIMEMGPMETEEEESDWWEHLPLAPAVTRLLLRQQTRRRWKPFALSHMVSRLPGLLEMHYEPWREWDEDDLWQRHMDEKTRRFVDSLATTGLRKLVIFENFNTAYPQRWRISVTDRREVFILRKADPNISKALARVSLKLEHLSASFMIEASDFFAARKPSWTWPNLTWLAVTSRLLLPNTSASERNAMLKAAAAAAEKMPVLETMEVWNGGKGSAMLFKYQRPKHSGYVAKIIRRGTWEFTLQNEVVRAWNAVARAHEGSHCIELEETLDAGEGVRSHGDAMWRLKLSRPVIRPISMWQIEMEHAMRLPEIEEGMIRDEH